MLRKKIFHRGFLKWRIIEKLYRIKAFSNERVYNFKNENSAERIGFVYKIVENFNTLKIRYRKF